MIWLASYPRSGNTFLRNILYEVYGLSSSTFHREPDYPLDKGWDSFTFVKTHELPEHLEPAENDFPAVYLVRDGRDALCSMAHHRADIVAPGSDYLDNLRSAIVAQRGSYFGGWSRNVEKWIRRADLIIRYEDLVADPLATVERLRTLCELPEPQTGKMPQFEALKFGIPKYGAARDQDVSEEDKQELAQKFFRRGEAGAWREEMPEELQELFWCYHGDAMERMGYRRDGKLAEPHRDLDGEVRSKLGFADFPPNRRHRVLIEADKLVSGDNDGVMRYQLELMRGLFPITQDPDRRWDFDLFVRGKIIPLADCSDILSQPFTTRRSASEEQQVEDAWENIGVPEPVQNFSTFLKLERALVAAVPRSFVAFLSERDITLLHDIYEAGRSVAVNLSDLVADLIARSVLKLRATQKRLSGSASRRAASADSARGLESYDLLHIPLQQHFRPFRRIAIPRMVTIHDLTHVHFPDSHTRANIRNAENGLRDAENRDAHMLAVSSATLRELVELRGLPQRQISVTHLGADPRRFSPRFNKEDCLAVRVRYGIDAMRPYLLCLSTMEPRKNLENTIAAFARLLANKPELDLSLVVAGKKGWGKQAMHSSVREIGSRLHFTGFVDDADVAYLYSDALALSYVSYYEGFGLPALEAMRCGTPVIFGNNSSLIEVVGDGGLPADPFSPEDIAEQFSRIVCDEALRAEKAACALRQANRYSWRHTAVQTLCAYEGLLQQAHAGEAE